MNRNTFALLDEGFQEVVSRKKRRRKGKNKETRTTEYVNTAVAKAPPAPIVEAAPVKHVQEENKTELRNEIISRLVLEAKKSKQMDREADVVAVLDEFEKEGIELESLDDPAFRGIILERIHARENKRLAEEMQDERERVPEELDTHETKEEEEPEEPPQELSLGEETTKQINELDFNTVEAEHILKDWIHKMTSSVSADQEKFRKVLNDVVVPDLAEKILTAESTRMPDSARSLRSYAGRNGLLVQFFDQLLQPLDSGGYAWFVDSLQDIATRLSESTTKKKTKEDLALKIKNCLFFLKKEPKHREEKQRPPVFTPPSNRFFSALDSESLESLGILQAVNALDTRARDYEKLRAQVQDESFKGGSEEHPNQSQRIEKFYEIHDQSTKLGKKCHATIVGKRREQEQVREEMRSMRSQYDQERNRLLREQQQFRDERERLLEQEKNLQLQLHNISLRLQDIDRQEEKNREDIDQNQLGIPSEMEKHEAIVQKIQEKIDQQESESQCYQAIKGIASNVIENLQSTQSSRNDQNFRQVMQEQFMRSGTDYINLLRQLMFDIKTNISRIEQANMNLSEPSGIYNANQQKALAEIRKIQNKKLLGLNSASQAVQDEIHQTQMNLKLHQQSQQSSYVERPSLRSRMPWSFETSLPPQSNVPEVVNDTQDAFYRKPPFVFGSLGQHPLSKPPQSRYSVKTQPLTPFNSNGPQEPDMQSPMQVSSHFNHQQKFNDIVDFNTPSQPPIETAPEEQSLTTQIIPEPVVDQPEEMIEQPEASPEAVQPVEPAPQRQRRRPISRSQPPSAPSDPAKGGPWASMIGKSKSNGGFMRIKRGPDKKDQGRKRQSNDVRRGGPRGRLYKGGRRV